MTKHYPPYYSQAKPCHTGMLIVFSVQIGTREVVFTAGGSSRNGRWDDVMTPPDLTIGPSETLGRGGDYRFPIGMEHLGAHTPKLIGLHWPDMHTPIVLDTMWDAIIKIIQEDQKIYHVHSQCMGGHGRTGVTLSILYNQFVKHGHKTVDALVKDLRDKYCDHIVEGKNQLKYIQSLTGLETDGTCMPYKEKPKPKAPPKSADKTTTKSATTTSVKHTTNLSKVTVPYTMEMSDVFISGDAAEVIRWLTDKDIKLEVLKDAIELMANHHGFEFSAESESGVFRYFLEGKAHSQPLEFNSLMKTLDYLYTLYDLEDGSMDKKLEETLFGDLTGDAFDEQVDAWMASDQDGPHGSSK